MVATGFVYAALDGQSAPFDSYDLARPIVGAIATYFVVNTGIVATAIALSTRRNVWTIWHDNFLWSGPSFVVAGAAGAVAASVVASGNHWLALLGIAPVYLTYRTYKVYMGRIEDQQLHVQRTSDLHLATIEALARAIDAKDQTTHMHIRRVQLYATGLAKAIGLSPDELQGVKTAALLHDIGKLAVPEHILSKPGPLTQEEFQKIRIHPQIGAEIIGAVPFPYPVAPLILSHHERWDGKGHPDGLAGNDVPVAIRVVAAARDSGAASEDAPPARSSRTRPGSDPARSQPATRLRTPDHVATFHSGALVARVAFEPDRVHGEGNPEIEAGAAPPLLGIFLVRRRPLAFGLAFAGALIAGAVEQTWGWNAVLLGALAPTALILTAVLWGAPKARKTATVAAQ